MFHRIAEAGEILVNDNVIRDTSHALAATFETASKGIIYEHRPSSPPAERLARELKLLLEGKDGQGPVASEQDLVEILRRVEQAAGDAGATFDGSNRAYLDLVGRLMRTSGDGTAKSDTTTPGETADPRTSLILP